MSTCSCHICESPCSCCARPGTFAVMSIMVGSVTERLAPDSNFVGNGTNGTVRVNIDARDAFRVQIACSLTVLTGIFQVCVSVPGSISTKHPLLGHIPPLLTNSPPPPPNPKILLGVVRFGFVVNYLSEPLVRGYTTGSACHVCVSQLKYLFGVSPSRFSGPLSLIYVSMWSIVPVRNSDREGRT